MSHRRAGIKRNNQKEIFQRKAQEISATTVQEMRQQLAVFKENLQQFATKHAQELRHNTVFRSRFQSLCLKIGVDPLQSQKSFWSSLGFGDFYYELCIQLVQICIQTRSTNGGLLEFNQAKAMLSKLRVNQPEISEVDMEAALKCLKASFLSDIASWRWL
jgi:ESCRT-II complex subunit VPS22